jgi:predicted nuclease of predicted toxin-antitoxin system
MRFLADENFPEPAVAALRQGGHDVLWIRTECPGISDDEVLRRAVAEHRILLTFDKDFGELAFKSRANAAPGIVLFRIRARSLHLAAAQIVVALESPVEWEGHFAVIESDRIRLLPLPNWTSE